MGKRRKGGWHETRTCDARNQEKERRNKRRRGEVNRVQPASAGTSSVATSVAQTMEGKEEKEGEREQ